MLLQCSQRPVPNLFPVGCVYGCTYMCSLGEFFLGDFFWFNTYSTQTPQNTEKTWGCGNWQGQYSNLGRSGCVRGPTCQGVLWVRPGRLLLFCLQLFPSHVPPQHAVFTLRFLLQLKSALAWWFCCMTYQIMLHVHITSSYMYMHVHVYVTYVCMYYVTCMCMSHTCMCMSST